MSLATIKMLIALAGVLLCNGGVFAAAAGTVDLFSGKPCHFCHRSKISGSGVHEALQGNRCTPCHKLSNGDHQADHRFSEAKDRSARLCYECHENRFRQKSVHRPIAEGDCLGCHDPHVSPHGRLLRAPVEQLCFRCHDRSLVDEEETVAATGFRNGNRNLHYLHARKSAPPCLACHQPHASSQDRLIRTQRPYGRDPSTLTYQPTANGGNCRSSCHGAAGYGRE